MDFKHQLLLLWKLKHLKELEVHDKDNLTDSKLLSCAFKNVQSNSEWDTIPNHRPSRKQNRS